MATAVAVTEETVIISIDKINGTLQAVVIPGTRDTVNFRANEDCELRFDNYKVFDQPNLGLQKGIMAHLDVKNPTETTGFEVWIPGPIAINFSIATTGGVPTKSKPWPILP